MTMTYSIYKQYVGTKILHLWDGPGYSLKAARALLKERETERPASKFFIVREED
jgi:hypothetical protein